MSRIINRCIFNITRRHFSSSTPKDPYSSLGVSKSASQSDIKKAYFNLAKKYHPDTVKNASESERATAKEKFVEIQQAYEILGDEQKRAEFDRFGFTQDSAGGGGPSGSPFGGQWQTSGDPAFAEEILRQFFGGRNRSPFGGGAGGFDFGDIFGQSSSSQSSSSAASADGPPYGNPRGEDLSTKITLGFLDAIKGTRRSIAYAALSRCGSCKGQGLNTGASPKKCSSCGGTGEQIVSQAGFRIMMTCSACNGAGSTIRHEDICKTCSGHGQVRERKEVVINVPAGVDSGEKIRVQGKGHTGTRGVAGDLYVTFEVQKPSPAESMFSRQGSDLVVEVPIPFYDAILGSEIPVPTLDDDSRPTIKIPPGTQPDFKTIIRGRGVPKVSKPGSRGDLHVRLKLSIPDLSKPIGQNPQLKELIEEFRMINAKRFSSSSNEDSSSNNEKNDNSNGFLKKTLGKLRDTLCDKDKNEDDKKEAKK